MYLIKKNILLFVAIFVLAVLLGAPFNSQSGDSSDSKELAVIKKQFGSVLKLTGSAAQEINAIANLLMPGSGMVAINLTHKSGEFCMLEPKTGRYMIHFSHAPEKTKEDILYFINPETFKQNGLQVNNLPSLPTELDKMKPFQWYYYNGSAFEPHHGGKLGREFLVMAIDVK